jgi:glycosyltransferase involved in cell wall biosynthesis
MLPPQTNPPPPLQVAHIVEATLTGVGRHVTDILAKLMQKQACTVHLIHSLNRADASYLARLQQIQPSPFIYEISMQRVVRPWADSVSLVRLMAYLLRQGPFDVVHLHSSKAAALGGLAARLSGVQHIVFTPNAFASAGETGLRRRIYLILERLCGLLAHTVIAVSQDEHDYALRHKLARPHQIHIIPNSVPLPDLQHHTQLRAQLRAEWNISEQTRLIGSVGRLSAQKNPLLFVEVATQRDRTVPLESEKFVIVGTGELLEEVRAVIQQRGLEQRMILAGFRTDMEAVYASLDVYMLHSRYEGMPYTVLEAMSHGLPVVAPDVPGIQELLGHSRFVVAPRDTVAFTNALTYLEDTDHRRDIGQENRQRIEQHLSLDTMVERILMLYYSRKQTYESPE